MNVEEVRDDLDGLSEVNLKRVRSYESHHKNRKILFERPDRKIGDGF